MLNRKYVAHKNYPNACNELVRKDHVIEFKSTMTEFVFFDDDCVKLVFVFQSMDIVL